LKAQSKNLNNKREELAFWINLYNILFLHSFLLLKEKVTTEDFGMKTLFYYQIGKEKYNLTKIKEKINENYSKGENSITCFSLLNTTKETPKLTIMNQESLLKRIEENCISYLLGNIKFQKERIVLPILIKEITNKVEKKENKKEEIMKIFKIKEEEKVENAMDVLCVCCDIKEEKEKFITMKCNHSFCKSCLDDIISFSYLCTSCKYDFENEIKEYFNLELLNFQKNVNNQSNDNNNNLNNQSNDNNNNNNVNNQSNDNNEEKKIININNNNEKEKKNIINNNNEEEKNIKNEKRKKPIRKDEKFSEIEQKKSKSPINLILKKKNINEDYINNEIQINIIDENEKKSTPLKKRKSLFKEIKEMFQKPESPDKNNTSPNNEINDDKKLISKDENSQMDSFHSLDLNDKIEIKDDNSSIKKRFKSLYLNLKIGSKNKTKNSPILVNNNLSTSLSSNSTSSLHNTSLSSQSFNTSESNSFWYKKSEDSPFKIYEEYDYEVEDHETSYHLNFNHSINFCFDIIKSSLSSDLLGKWESCKNSKKFIFSKYNFSNNCIINLNNF
jgi:hypothetical protein